MKLKIFKNWISTVLGFLMVCAAVYFWIDGKLDNTQGVGLALLGMIFIVGKIDSYVKPLFDRFLKIKE